ncbi:J domain-containing protein [Lujinxingia vulgaris]|uniref:J domain-containing protein n=1 Tax=Lujinxingia vulgaris TaxID=2600176 RepID=A0A5C6XA65_9DELT|nr:J domain-containing protein [Lujinxingia vulgaris]TXD34928.1 J domain-containing protein [Lujinxingia vulgaris]
MSELKDRLMRTVRANLNHLLDNVQKFEERGGLRSIINPESADEGWEEIGQNPRPASANAAPPATQGPKTLRDYYANLEVPYGSDLPTVKAAYRNMMRRYHPDNFANDPEMEKVATNLSQELAVAYQAIERYLRTGSY